jgi:hypothetical protein
MSVVASAQRISETKEQAYIVKVVFLAAILSVQQCLHGFAERSVQTARESVRGPIRSGRQQFLRSHWTLRLERSAGRLPGTNDPLGIRDSACGVSQQEKKSGKLSWPPDVFAPLIDRELKDLGGE